MKIEGLKDINDLDINVGSKVCWFSKAKNVKKVRTGVVEKLTVKLEKIGSWDPKTHRYVVEETKTVVRIGIEPENDESGNSWDNDWAYFTTCYNSKRVGVLDGQSEDAVKAKVALLDVRQEV